MGNNANSGQNQLNQPDSLNVTAFENYIKDPSKNNLSNLNTTASQPPHHEELNLTVASNNQKREKKPALLSTNPSQHSQQIKRAKKKYETKKSKNEAKLNQLTRIKQRYDQIYGDVPQKQQSEQLNEGDESDGEQVLIWGQKVKLKSKGKIDEQQTIFLPHQQTDQTGEEYTNWKIYKRKMQKERKKQVEEELQKLREQENQLKDDYESLVQQREDYLRRIKEAEKKEKEKSDENSGQTPNNKQSIDTPSFAISNKLEEKEPQKPFRKKQTAPQVKLPVKKADYEFDDSQVEDASKQDFWYQDENEYSDDQYDEFGLMSPYELARLILFFQIYILKRRSNYVNAAPSYHQHINRYPRNRELDCKPARRQENEYVPYQSRSKSKERRERRQRGQRHYGFQENSVYKKVYEKIPKNLKTHKIYYNDGGNVKQLENFYSTVDTIQSRRQRAIQYPKILAVDDSIAVEDEDDFLAFHSNPTRGQYYKQIKTPKGQNNRSFLVEEDSETLLTEEQKQIKRLRKLQRKYEATILQKVRIKNL